MKRLCFLVAHELGATGWCKRFTRGLGKLSGMHKHDGVMRSSLFRILRMQTIPRPRSMVLTVAARMSLSGE